MENQLTAIEWLVEQLEQQIVLSKNPNLLTKRTGDYRIGLRHAIDLCDQAKQMEKEQMKEMYLKGIENYDPTFKRK